MNFFALSALVNLVTSIILGALILLTDRRSRVNQLFAAFALSIAFWSYSYFFWQISGDANSALFWSHMLMAGAILITPIYFHFVAHFFGRADRHRMAIRLGYVFILFFSIANWIRLTFISGTHPISMFDFWPIPGPLFIPF